MDSLWRTKKQTQVTNGPGGDQEIGAPRYPNTLGL